MATVLVLLISLVLVLVLRTDPREQRARQALAVGVLEQTRDVGRLELNESESAGVLDKTEDVEVDLAKDDGARRSDLACGKRAAWRLTDKETIEVCVLVEPDSGRLVGSFQRVPNKSRLVGARCRGRAIVNEVRCRGR